MIRDHQLVRLEADLAEEYLELNLLIDTLASERSALSRGLEDQIAALAAEKERHIEAVTRKWRARCDWLESHGGARNMPEFLLRASRTPGIDALRSSWLGVQTKAREAKRMNDENGLLLAIHSRQLHARLNALFGAAGRAGTYGRSGGMRVAAPSRMLAAA